MPRGRKKDLTIPPTRALEHQRNYRARRAQYVTDLEERCRIADAEVIRLRRELAIARGDAGDGRHENRDTELVGICKELVENLAATSAAVERFQERLGEGTGSGTGSASPTPLNRDKVPPPPAGPTSNLDLLVTAILSNSSRLPAESLVPSSDVVLDDASSPSLETEEDDDMDPLDVECCGGFLDCRDLVSR